MLLIVTLLVLASFRLIMTLLLLMSMLLLATMLCHEMNGRKQAWQRYGILYCRHTVVVGGAGKGFARGGGVWQDMNMAGIWHNIGIEWAWGGAGKGLGGGGGIT